MTCQRCHDGEARFLVHSDITMEGERIVCDLRVCSFCAWKVFEWRLPGHRVLSLTYDYDRSREEV